MNWRDLWRVLLTPHVWFPHGRYSEVWDRRLRELMETETFVQPKYGRHTATLGSATVWVRNHPYAPMSPGFANVRPRRATILRAYDKFVGDMLLPRAEG